jgi:predicted nucleotidyltransferase
LQKTRRLESFLNPEGYRMDIRTDMTTSDPALARIIRRLVTAYEPEQIFLFGSRARGDAGQDSDYDLLLVVPDHAPPERKRSKLAYRVLWGTGTAADVVVWTRSAFDSRIHLAASLPATVMREGKLLHAA